MLFITEVGGLNKWVLEGFENSPKQNEWGEVRIKGGLSILIQMHVYCEANRSLRSKNQITDRKIIILSIEIVLLFTRRDLGTTQFVCLDKSFLPTILALENYRQVDRSKRIEPIFSYS